jgi:hypothetical protein
LPEGLIGLPKARRHGDLAVFELGADAVANFLQWRDHLSDKAPRLLKDLLHDGLVNLRKDGQLSQCTGVGAGLLHQKQRLLGLGLVVGHDDKGLAQAIRSRP